ncbi:hypothetical protein [Aneurinibacillus uraniidurans]|uniref:hypothetical protein n=1 Tax=Aneurinibacillus uraniidurans TaxID=2966586 RepID=UPI00234BE6E4|nr:hypothetical protein [Aneurinibacillus sp. B1]WCN37253.1 hypothetical protein PO771_15610 [Aneurinibacillus sp. B1]
MEKETAPSYLHSLAGRVVRVYKGGPESRMGYIVEVKPEHLVLFNDEDGFLYYNTNHIKSVCDSSQDDLKDKLLQKSTTNEKDTSEHLPHIQAESFWDVLKTMEGHTVRINRGGHHSKVGRLVSVKDDYLVLETEKDGLLYYYIHHIKSVSGSKKQEKLTLKMMLEGNLAQADASETMPHAKAENMESLLQELQYRWVRINGEGPESIEGVLSDNSASSLTIVANQHVYQVPLFHIRTISQTIAQVSSDDKANKNEANSAAKTSSTNNEKGDSTNKQTANTKQNNKQDDSKKQENGKKKEEANKAEKVEEKKHDDNTQKNDRKKPENETAEKQGDSQKKSAEKKVKMKKAEKEELTPAVFPANSMLQQTVEFISKTLNIALNNFTGLDR